MSTSWGAKDVETNLTRTRGTEKSSEDIKAGYRGLLTESDCYAQTYGYPKGKSTEEPLRLVCEVETFEKRIKYDPQEHH